MDENYYVLNVKVRENLTDTRAVERMKAWDEFFANPANKNCTKEQVLQQRDKIENQVWQNAPKGETPIN